MSYAGCDHSAQESWSFCPHCGTSVERDQPRWEFCDIRRETTDDWFSDRVSQWVAYVGHPTRGEYVAARSRTWRTMMRHAMHEASVAAHEELTRNLVADGWSLLPSARYGRTVSAVESQAS